MIKEIPFNKKAHCDLCHKQGAYDFTGDYICEDCLAIYQENKPKND